MDFAGNRYYTPNRILLTCLGLWPYYTQRAKCIHFIFLSPFILSGIIFQLSSFITKEYSIDLLLNILSFAGPTAFCLLKYFATLFNGNKIKQLTEQVRYDWDSLKEEEELEIIRKYSNCARLGTIVLTILMFISLFLFTLTFFSSNILDIVMPLNESRKSWQFPTSMEYFIDQEKYAHFLALYLFLIGLTGTITIVATETFLLMYVQHVCAMFRITSYRIERIINRSHVESLVLSKKFKIRKNIVNAIDSHQRAIQAVDSLKSVFGIAYISAIPLSVGSLSINLFRFSECIMASDIGAINMSFLYVSGHLCYMFFSNYLGQEMINHSENVFRKICDTQWYATSLNTKKCLLMMMHRSMKTSSLTFGCLFVLSFEGFATLLSMSLSYFMVIYSTRQL